MVAESSVTSSASTRSQGEGDPACSDREFQHPPVASEPRQEFRLGDRLRAFIALAVDTRPAISKERRVDKSRHTGYLTRWIGGWPPDFRASAVRATWNAMGMSSEQRYAEWPARRSPRGSVACLWASRPSETSAGRVLPDACIDIIWDGTSLFVAGPDTGPVPIIARSGQFFAGLRFLPGRAPGFLGVPASELLDSRVPLADLWGRAPAGRLADRLASAPSPEAAAGVLARAVGDRALKTLAPDPPVAQLVATYTTTPPAPDPAVQSP